MFTLIGYVGLMSSSFAVVTIQIMLVSSKTREIGIMRSIGEKRSNILIIFVIQGAVIGVMGAVTGLIFGIGFTAYADYSKFSFLGGLILDVEYSWDSLLTTAFMAFCLALGASIYPALKATKLQPLEAMKSV
jgi:lipoprotein-releasing system permease protein